jgi:hypothetical protein
MDEGKQVGYVYKLTTNLGAAQQLEITGNLALDADKQAMDLQFDILTAVTGRLAAKHKADEKRAELAATEAVKGSMVGDLELLDKTSEGRTLNTGEKSSRASMVANIRHLEGKIATIKTELEGLVKQAE